MGATMRSSEPSIPFPPQRIKRAPNHRKQPKRTKTHQNAPKTPCAAVGPSLAPLLGYRDGNPHQSRDGNSHGDSSFLPDGDSSSRLRRSCRGKHARGRLRALGGSQTAPLWIGSTTALRFAPRRAGRNAAIQSSVPVPRATRYWYRGWSRTELERAERSRSERDGARASRTESERGGRSRGETNRTAIESDRSAGKE